MVAKKASLMNMLETQNTLVSIINPPVLTCVRSLVELDYYYRIEYETPFV